MLPQPNINAGVSDPCMTQPPFDIPIPVQSIQSQTQLQTHNISNQPKQNKSVQRIKSHQHVQPQPQPQAHPMVVDQAMNVNISDIQQLTTYVTSILNNNLCN